MIEKWVEKSQQEANPGGQKEALESLAPLTRLIDKHMKEIAEVMRQQ